MDIVKNFVFTIGCILLCISACIPLCICICACLSYAIHYASVVTFDCLSGSVCLCLSVCLSICLSVCPESWLLVPLIPRDTLPFVLRRVRISYGAGKCDLITFLSVCLSVSLS